MNRILRWLSIAIVALFCTACGNDSIYIDQVSEVDDASLNLTAGDTYNMQDAPMYVQIGGAVVNPGVYEVTEGTRVYQLIEMAGGFTSDAAADQINQVTLLSDGELVRIPTVEEYERSKITEEAMASGLIDINLASKADLMTLPGIGESKAQAIISYRDDKGAFSCIEDLCNVPGIKEGTIAKFKDKIIVR